MSKSYIAILCTLFLWSNLGQSARGATGVTPERENGAERVSERAAETLAEETIAASVPETSAELPAQSIAEVDKALR